MMIFFLMVPGTKFISSCDSGLRAIAHDGVTSWLIKEPKQKGAVTSLGE